MRKILALLFAVLLLCPSARAAETEEKYIALTFDEGPSGRCTRQLLEGLAQREAKATFFLWGCRLEQHRSLAEEILAAGHEIGIHGYSQADMGPMSRRTIAKELSDTRVLLPEDCQVRFLRPAGGRCSDAVRQVAEVTGLAILDWSVDPKQWAARNPAMGGSVLNQIQDGDVVLLRDMTDSDLTAALNLIDLLKNRGFRFVTVSELAKLRETKIRPGQFYSSFPAG